MTIYKDYLKAAIIQVNTFDKYLTLKKPNVIFMLSGLFAAERVMFEIARKKNQKRMKLSFFIKKCDFILSP